MGIFLILLGLLSVAAAAGGSSGTPTANTTSRRSEARDAEDDDMDPGVVDHSHSHDDMPSQDDKSQDKDMDHGHGASQDPSGQTPPDHGDTHGSHDTGSDNGNPSQGSSDEGGHGSHDNGSHNENPSQGSSDEDGHGSHDGHTHPPAVTPPQDSATQDEIDAFVAEVKSQPEMHVHDHGSELMGEHMAAMNLVPRDEATHIAVSAGAWDDPDTWYNGAIPTDGANVLIPEGITVTYGFESAARLDTVRVDGTLDFATDTDSQIVFDTMVVSPTGHLVIGTEQAPIDPNVTVDLIIANNGPIDTDWDPFLLSRGVISHGKATIHGASKDSHEKVIEDPMAGDTFVKFDSLPEGWQAGDKIVIAGTHYDGYKWDNTIRDVRLYPPEDEVRFISHIEGNTVHFEDPLVFDHDAPRDDLHTSVANYTRNVSIETENAEDAEVFERGHVMFMHSDDVDVRYAEFSELGRTDKSETSKEVSDFDPIRYDSNVQGRYALHLHRTGVDDLNDPAIVIGNSVFGSPGWGFVHHDSNAVLENNASFDTFGAGFVAETGNETGLWIDNIAIQAIGIGWDLPKNTTDIGPDTFDTARGGHGFWFQGRLVGSVDNVAASVSRGFVYFHRDGDDRMIDFEADHFAYPDALFGSDAVTADDAPILLFQDNEAFAASEGLHVVKANPNQGHDVWSHLEGFTAWGVENGAHLQYTSHYILKDFDVVGKDPSAQSGPLSGISFGSNTSEIVIIDPTISGFQTGIDLNKNFTVTTTDPGLHDYVVIDADISDTDTPYGNYDPNLDVITSRSELDSVQTQLDLDPIVYQRTPGGWMAEINGTKTDGLGEIDFPGGTDSFIINHQEVVNLLETEGYWTTSDGDSYFLADIYFTDRSTGDVFFETHPVFIDPAAAVHLGSPHWALPNAVHNGEADFNTVGGSLFAGSTLLETPIAVAAPTAVPPSTDLDSAALMDMLTANQTVMHDHMPSDDMSHDHDTLADVA